MPDYVYRRKTDLLDECLEIIDYVRATRCVLHRHTQPHRRGCSAIGAVMGEGSWLYTRYNANRLHSARSLRIFSQSLSHTRWIKEYPRLLQAPRERTIPASSKMSYNSQCYSHRKIAKLRRFAEIIWIQFFQWRSQSFVRNETSIIKTNIPWSFLYITDLPLQWWGLVDKTQKSVEHDVRGYTKMDQHARFTSVISIHDQSPIR